jgi:hypothetical protein
MPCFHRHRFNGVARDTAIHAVLLEEIVPVLV